METIHLGLRDIYRATDVRRWGLVKTARPQSLAEHSYQVAMIAARLCQLYKVGEEVTCKAVWYALVHDLPEVLTGDIATPFKDLLGPGVREQIQQFEDRVRVMGAPVHEEDAHARMIVKLADILEAIAFLHQNAPTDHGRVVLRGLQRHIQPGTPAECAMHELLHGEEVTLDSLREAERKEESVA